MNRVNILIITVLSCFLLSSCNVDTSKNDISGNNREFSNIELPEKKVSGYDREQDLIKYLRKNHEEFFNESSFSLLIYREPCDCGYKTDTLVLDNITNANKNHGIAKTYMIYDKDKIRDELNECSKSGILTYVQDDPELLDRAGIRKTPYLFVFKNGNLIEWQSLS